MLLAIDTQSNLSFRKIFYFWLPLASTWLMMSCEGPLIAAIIARLADPKFNLAAYGVAFSIALLVESPIIMMMTASTALVKDRDSYRKLRNFTYVLNFIITLILLSILYPPFFNFLIRDLIHLPEEVASLAYLALVIMLPWPAAIGFRRFFQGILIRSGRTRRVAYATVLRLLTMAATAFSLYYFFEIPGVYVGTAALSTGVVMEALAVRIMVNRNVQDLPLKEVSLTNEAPLTYKFIARFYYPLAVTTILQLAIRPVVTFFAGMGKYPVESVAVLQVIISLVFIFSAPGLAYQEVTIALTGKEKEGYILLRNFALILGIGTTLGLVAIAYTPLASVWYHKISGLSQELTEFVRIPTQIVAFMPGLILLLIWQRALLVNAKQTDPITYATILEFILIIVIMFIGIRYLDLSGAILAAIALMAGRTGACVYLSRNKVTRLGSALLSG